MGWGYERMIKIIDRNKDVIYFEELPKNIRHAIVKWADSCINKHETENEWTWLQNRQPDYTRIQTVIKE
jgi:hypothetical protein